MNKILLIFTITLFGAGCTQHKEMTLADVQSKVDLIEYGKTKQSQEDWKKGQDLVREFKATLPGKSPEELIALFVTHPKFGFIVASPPEYYLYRDGNEAIKAELMRRGEAVKPTLIKYRDDVRMLFTGDNGPAINVGSICEELLYEMNQKNPNQRVDLTR